MEGILVVGHKVKFALVPLWLGLMMTLGNAVYYIKARFIPRK